VSREVSTSACENQRNSKLERDRGREEGREERREGGTFGGGGKLAFSDPKRQRERGRERGGERERRERE
jgi:hypothetical protein